MNREIFRFWMRLRFIHSPLCNGAVTTDGVAVVLTRIRIRNAVEVE